MKHRVLSVLIKKMSQDSLFSGFLMIMLLLTGCSASKHVPEGQYLLDNVRLHITDSAGNLDSRELLTYVRQQPNHKMLWSTKFRLGVYNLSGKDTTKWWNRWIRKLGEPPVIYDSAATAADVEQLRRALINKGYMGATVSLDSFASRRKKKIDLDFTVDPGTPHIIRSIEYVFPDDTLKNLIINDSLHFTIKEGDPLNRTRLETEREVITTYLRNKGYYGFTKEFITFNADTTSGSYDVDLTMVIKPQLSEENPNFLLPTHKPYIVRNIYVITDYEAEKDDDIRQYHAVDTVGYKDITILYGKKQYLRPGILYDNCFIRAGAPYRLNDVNRTYQAFSRLSILKFINIRFVRAGNAGGMEFLDAYILLTPGKSQSFSIELEGTNSEGDLGVAVGVSYNHRNVGKGSETLSTKIRGAYESLSGNLEGLIHNRYLELSGEAGLLFPKFKAPFLRESFKRKIKASTEFNVSLNYQERPEYTRIISTAGWSYKWSERGNGNRHTFTPIDINYVYLPESTNNFIDEIAPDNPLLRYSYEDHFIMRLGYNFYHTNKRQNLPWTRGYQSDIFTLRVNAEIAGNLLFAISNIFNHRSNFREDPYKIFGIRYSQYFKIEGDYALVHTFDERNSLAFHVGAGVGVPYGNSYMLPFEKRFYGGGANGVRGWDVRTLGPGRFPGTNSVSDFINQCGDIRFETSVEYRAKLFWVVELGAFIDAGNIWTIRDYPNQPDGLFRFNSFYKELAAAYGLGVRLDFTYFLLRFDLGMKAHNPAVNQEPWPLIHPNWHRDSSFHFSIGYPF